MDVGAANDRSFTVMGGGHETPGGPKKIDSGFDAADIASGSKSVPTKGVADLAVQVGATRLGTLAPSAFSHSGCGDGGDVFVAFSFRGAGPGVG